MSFFLCVTEELLPCRDAKKLSRAQLWLSYMVRRKKRLALRSEQQQEIFTPMVWGSNPTLLTT